MEPIFPERKFVPLIEQMTNFSNSNPLPFKTDLSPVVKSKEILKHEQDKKLYEKRTNDKWKKALKEFDINENLLSDKQELLQHEPFKSYNIKNVQMGIFKDQQLSKIVLEVVTLEVINSCFQCKLRDLAGDEIHGTFHADCKELIKSNRFRKGSLVILNDVSEHFDYMCRYRHFRLPRVGTTLLWSLLVSRSSCERTGLNLKAMRMINFSQNLYF